MFPVNLLQVDTIAFSNLSVQALLVHFPLQPILLLQQIALPCSIRIVNRIGP